MTSFVRLAVLGDPIDHSRSPAIQTAALAIAGIPGEYTAIRADRSGLVHAIGQLREGDLAGINVTMPLKGDAWELADSTTREASRARSINTMRCREGVVEGHSTDVVAFEDLVESGPFDAGAPVLILGAGGSARAALTAFGSRVVYLSARSQASAEALADEFAVSAVPWATPVAGALVVNATPLGMHLETLPDALLEAAGGLIDLPYSEGVTPAMSKTLSSAIPSVDGFEFLARQAAASFEWWTGVAIDFRQLASVAKNA